MMIRLYNVIDTRTGRFHSVAVVSRKNAKWFVEAEPPEEEVEEDETE